MYAAAYSLRVPAECCRRMVSAPGIWLGLDVLEPWQRLKSAVYIYQGPHCTRKTGKMTQNIPVRENTGNLEFFDKTQGKHRKLCLLNF